MKLAEALQERADLNRLIQQLNYRLNNNVLVQEGEETSEDPIELKKKLDSAMERLIYLVNRINITNCNTVIDGKSLTEIIGEKDALSLKVSIYQDVVNHASSSTDRARGSEIKIRPSISVSKWQKEIDDISKKIRLLDNKLQESNWLTDLSE